VTDEDDKLRLGISSCLLGRKVRYDGQHKRDDFLVDVLGQFVTWVPVCPEVEVGMGVPRDTLRLVRADRLTRMVVSKTGQDWTDRMNDWAAGRVQELSDQQLCGYVLKKDSPSCGMERVKVYDSNDPRAMGVRDGVGLFAAALMAAYPRLPIEEEGRLQDARLRDNFIERVFAYHRLRQFFSGRWNVGSLVAFHAAQKLTLLAHSPDGYRALGRLVAQGKRLPRPELRARYEEQFMAALGKMATPGRHANVLQHMAGYMKRSLDEGSKVELLQLIEDFRNGLVPLVVPVTLMKHHVRRLGIAYLADQVYLDPHPKELMLRNRV
jgi:uncharacterized protein YbgA (DUF1722 family)/uncharacterized protein YbbK (DUF523 family)